MPATKSPGATTAQLGDTKEKRRSVLRRQINESFCSPDGQVSWAKTMANLGQLSALAHFTWNFTALMDKWDSLLVILGMIIAPDVVKKIISMKYGGAEK